MCKIYKFLIQKIIFASNIKWLYRDAKVAQTYHV